MLQITFLLTIFTVCISQAQTYDLLLQKTLSLKTDQIEKVLNKTKNNIKLFADNFDVKLDSGSQITSQKQVGGTQLQPVLKISIKKCVFLICQNIDLDAEFALTKTSGLCDFNYQLNLDLERSSALLTDLYTAIKADVCIQKNSTGAQARLIVNLKHSKNYQAGIIQKQAFGFIKLQADGLLKSFRRVMIINGVLEVVNKDVP